MPRVRGRVRVRFRLRGSARGRVPGGGAPLYDVLGIEPLPPTGG